MEAFQPLNINCVGSIGHLRLRVFLSQIIFRDASVSERVLWPGNQILWESYRLRMNLSDMSNFEWLYTINNMLVRVLNLVDTRATHIVNNYEMAGLTSSTESFPTSQEDRFAVGPRRFAKSQAADSKLIFTMSENVKRSINDGNVNIRCRLNARHLMLDSQT